MIVSSNFLISAAQSTRVSFKRSSNVWTHPRISLRTIYNDSASCFIHRSFYYATGRGLATCRGRLIAISDASWQHRDEWKQRGRRGFCKYRLFRLVTQRDKDKRHRRIRFYLDFREWTAREPLGAGLTLRDSKYSSFEVESELLRSCIV